MFASLVLVSLCAEVDIEYHQRASGISESVEQLSVQPPVPIITGLPEGFACRVIHEDEDDLVCDGPRAETKQVIITGVSKSVAERHRPKSQPAKTSQRRPDDGPEQPVFGDGVKSHGLAK